MNFLNLLESLESAKGSNEKKAVLASGAKDPNFLKVLDLALNFHKKFFISKFKEPLAFGPGISENQFFGILDTLASRKATGNAALKLVEDTLTECTELQSKWLSRIIRKDLRCNVGPSLASAAGLQIKEFDVMLAKDGNDVKDLDAILADRPFISPKLDGYRCIAIVDNNEVHLYSRNGKEYENFPSIAASLSEICINAAHNAKYIFDGEIMSSSFNDMQKSAFASKRGTTVGDVEYHIFDMITFEDWEAGKFKDNMEKRYDRLIMWHAMWQFRQHIQNIKIVMRGRVDDRKSLVEKINEYISLGYEGLMLNPNQPYYLGRKVGGMLKFKKFLSQDCKIVGVYEGLGKHAGAAGGVKVLQENGVECDVGSGLSDELRRDMWTNKDNYIGRILEVTYQELSKDGVMRFPVFERFREDKRLDDI